MVFYFDSGSKDLLRQLAASLGVSPTVLLRFALSEFLKIHEAFWLRYRRQKGARYRLSVWLDESLHRRIRAFPNRSAVARTALAWLEEEYQAAPDEILERLQSAQSAASSWSPAPPELCFWDIPIEHESERCQACGYHVFSHPPGDENYPALPFEAVRFVRRGSNPPPNWKLLRNAKRGAVYVAPWALILGEEEIEPHRKCPCSTAPVRVGRDQYVVVSMESWSDYHADLDLTDSPDTTGPFESGEGN